MNSPFANLYIEIRDRLKAVVPSIRWIDCDLGQLENYNGDRPPVTFPCALIDFQDFNFSDMSLLSQIAEGSVIIRLAYTPFSSAASVSQDTVTAKALEYYEIEWLVYKFLHGWTSLGGCTLMRTAVEKESREDHIVVRAMTFSTTFQDNSAGIDLSVASPDLVTQFSANAPDELPDPPFLP